MRISTHKFTHTQTHTTTHGIQLLSKLRLVTGKPESVALTTVYSAADTKTHINMHCHTDRLVTVISLHLACRPYCFQCLS